MGIKKIAFSRAFKPWGNSCTWRASFTPKHTNWCVNHRTLSAFTRPSFLTDRLVSPALGKEKEQKQRPGRRKGGYVHLKVHSGGQIGNFGPLWLRDNCQCSSCIHPDTRQRTVDTSSIPFNIHVRGAQYDSGGVRVQWSDGHEGVYSFPWLYSHRNHFPPTPEASSKPLGLRRFKKHEPGNQNYPTVLYSDVMADDQALGEWLEKIYVWGFCFVKGVPIDPESTKTLIERIAFIRHTHYGGFWDFTADLTFKDTAYTTEFLGGHTDNTYFTDPARLQLFHLLSHTDGDGGASLLVDGFQAAKVLQLEDPMHANILAMSRQPFHSSGNDETCIQPASQASVFEVHPELKRLYRIRWNNYDRAAKVDWSLKEQNQWYAATRHYDWVTKRKNAEVWTQLEPGTALIFDNWRMLHGRSEFTGKRRMCGGYVNNDDFISRYRLLKFGREKVLQNLGRFVDHESNPNSYI